MDKRGVEDVEVRPIASLEDARFAADLIDGIWGDTRIVTPALLRALADHGNPLFLAVRGGEAVGAQVAFLGREEGRTILHSHITGVAPGAEHRGVGYRLKLHQREWCLANGIDVVTWTFDPLVARNAYFNLEKLGAVAHRFHRNLYGPMHDAFNAGDRSDRLEVRWAVASPRVNALLEGRVAPPDTAGADVLLDAEGDAPVPRPLGDAPRLVIRVPTDYHALRSADRTLATAWRDAVADGLDTALAAGYRAVRFLRDGAYILDRA